ncbi:DNRLRE domain-containing protein, partial [Candidatus Poribacteria bacterium]
MDTHITEYSGNNMNNMGGNIENECCEYDPANTDGKSVLIWFDVSSIPTNAVLAEATLELYMTSNRNGGNDKEVAAHRLLKEWGEGTGSGIDGRAAIDGEVCGLRTGKGEDWAKAGADEPGEDFVEKADDTIEIGAGIGEWYTWDITEMCQYWISNPDENFGAILLEPRPHAATLGTKVFASKENANA